MYNTCIFMNVYYYYFCNLNLALCNFTGCCRGGLLAVRLRQRSFKVDDVVVTDKKHMAELFNHHFIKSGFLLDSVMTPSPSNISSSPTPSNATIPNASPSFSHVPLQSFSLQVVTESEVLKEILKLAPPKNIWFRWFRPFLL